MSVAMPPIRQYIYKVTGKILPPWENRVRCAGKAAVAMFTNHFTISLESVYFLR
jgi:hypothetical protein